MTERPFGLDLTDDECDRIYLRLVALHPSMVEDDVYLFGQKWFDYRFMSSVQANFTFAHAYNEAYRDCYRRHVSHTHGENLRGIDVSKLFDFGAKNVAGLRTGCVKARQWADAMTMPYDVYCRIALEWTMRRSRKFLPRISQIYGFDLLTAIKETWEKEQAGRIFVAGDDRYKNRFYQGAPAQDAHHQWLLEQAAKRANPVYTLSRFLFEDQMLPESKVAARFGTELLEHARSVAS